MSRSRRKTPKVSIASTQPGEMKKWKRECARKIRRMSIQEDIGPFKKYCSVWGAPSDGKTPYKSPYWASKETWKRLMRK